MKYQLKNGKSVNIPDTEIANNCKCLGITKEEAIQMWLEDNDYEVNDEQEQLDKKAKAVKIDHDARAVDPTKKAEKKPRTVKISDEKQELFGAILQNLTTFYANNVTVLTENKLIQVKIGNKTFKIDIIQQRNK